MLRLELAPRDGDGRQEDVLCTPAAAMHRGRSRCLIKRFRWGHNKRMRFGRLIRVRSHRGDPEASVYVVAEAEPAKAVEVLRLGIVRPLDEYEDLGRVTDHLLAALNLEPGQFTTT
jgi:hypothetical protein